MPLRTFRIQSRCDEDDNLLAACSLEMQRLLFLKTQEAAAGGAALSQRLVKDHGIEMELENRKVR